MNKLQLATLFQQKVKDLRAKDPEQARILGGELLNWASVVAPFAGGGSVWDIVYSQIQPIARRQGISEEQVIHDLFASGSAETFMLALQLG